MLKRFTSLLLLVLLLTGCGTSAKSQGVYYQLDITETDTKLTFDLLVEERHVPLAEEKYVVLNRR